MANGFDAVVLDGLIHYYSIEDLRTLCLRLGVDYDSLAQANRDVLARELLSFMRRDGRLSDLIHELRRERPHFTWPDPPTGDGRPDGPPAVPLQFPPAATHFTGRADELDELTAALLPGRIVTLYGPGGIGKTALAGAALRAMEGDGALPARFPGGVVFHTFYGRPAAAEAATAVARAYGHVPNPDPFAALEAALRDRVALLVLDGAEEADDLRALLDRRGRCGVLVTSRRRTDVFETGIEVERLPAADALALLRALAGAFAADETAAAEVCELVGNLPLALRVAGRYLFQRGEYAAEYAAWLREAGLAALDFGARRRESVPVLLDRSVAHVSAAARAALGVAGCLALRPFDAAPVAAALELSRRATRDALGALHDYELLRRAGDRYEATHPLVHGYARERLAVEPEALRRLGEYYAALAEAESEKGPPGYARLEPERQHLLAVLPRLAAAEAWATANELAWAVEDWLDIRGYPRDRIAALEVGLEAARALEQRRDESSHLNHLGLAYAALGQVERAIGYYEEALAVAREVGDRRGEGADLGNLGNAYYSLGQVERAIGYYEEALAVAREIGDRRGEGADLGNLGVAYAALGQVERAIGYYEAALAVAREIGDRRGEGNRLGNLGNAYADLGQVERAIGYHEEALAVAREIGDRRGEGNRLGNLGVAYADLGQVERAIGYYEEALAVAREIGDRRGEGNRLYNRALALERLGRLDEAVALMAAALAAYEAIDAPQDAADAREQLARLRGAG